MSDNAGNARAQRRTDASSSKKTSLDKWYRLVESQEDENQSARPQRVDVGDQSPCQLTPVGIDLEMGGCKSS